MPIIEMEQNTDEWLTFRKSHIGASDVPVILGVSPYSTALILWKKKLGFEEEEPMHAGMLYGHNNESKVRELAQHHLKMRFDPVVMQHEEYEWATASLDGWNEENKVAIEIKCPNEEDHDYAKKGNVPDKYYPQVQWQIFVSGAKSAYYCSWRKDEFISIPVPINRIFINKALREAQYFYDCLVNYIPPAESERDYVKIDDAEFGAAAIAWMQIKETLDEAKKQERDARDRLASFTDDGNCEGYGIRMTRIKQKGSIDWDKVCEDHKIDKYDLEKYRKPQIGFWKISILNR